VGPDIRTGRTSRRLLRPGLLPERRLGPVPVLLAPPLRGRWHLESGPLAFDESGDLVRPLEFSLAEVTVGAEGALGEIGTIATSAGIRRDLSQIVVHELTIDGLRAEVTPDWLPERSSGRPEPPVSPAASPATGSTPETDPVEWRLESLELGESVLRVSGFDGSEGPFAMPDLALTTSLSLTDVTFSEGRWNSAGPVELELRDVAFGSPPDSPDSQLAFAERIALSSPTLGATD